MEIFILHRFNGQANLEVLGEGVEPTHLSVPDPKSGASANSAIRAKFLLRLVKMILLQLASQ